MPVTSIERHLKDGEYIVSKTNLKGQIVYINRPFLKISGFTEEELMGAPYNIVRHPDMPREAFEDLWRMLKTGKPWRGMVKNRCKLRGSRCDCGRDEQPGRAPSAHDVLLQVCLIRRGGSFLKTCPFQRTGGVSRYFP